MHKKIAISTWYSNGNYGGTLQAYALQKTLERLGYKSEFINLISDKNSIRYKIKRNMKNLAIFVYKPKFYISRLKIFRFVNENLNISKPYYKYTDLEIEAENKYSAAICGSDQIWANVGGNIDELSYLTFISPKKRIAYAPSTGYNRIQNELKPKFKEYIDNIEFLSVREKQGAEFIEKITGNKAAVVLDPSLLLEKKDWENYINTRKNYIKNEKYIFCYFLGKNEEYMNYAKWLSRETGYKIIAMQAKHMSLKGAKKITGDPFDFLNYIRDAQYVLTDSFHGVCFSINLEKQFGVFKRFKDDDPINQNARIFNLLEKVELENRVISINEKEKIKEKTDYAKVKMLLNKERKESLEYLTNALKSVVDK